MSPESALRARSGRRDGVLVAAALITGATGATTLIVSQRYLELDSFAPLAQLWTIWAVLAAGLTYSFQQWAAVHGVTRGDLLPGGSAARVTVALCAASATMLVITTSTRDGLFHSTSWAWPAAAAALPIGTALNGVRRGELARQHRRTSLGVIIAGENAIRLAVSLALISLNAGAAWFAFALLAGFLVVLGPAGSSPPPGDATNGLGALGAAAAAGFLAHAFMFGSPLLLAAAGGTASDVSALFLVLAGVRIPFVMLQAVVPQLAVGLATSADLPLAVSKTKRWLVLITLGGSVSAATGGYVLGDAVIGSIFGIRGEVDAKTYALLAGAAVLAACALVATVVLVVEGRPRRVALAWAVPVATVPIVIATGVAGETALLALWLVAVQATVVGIELVPPRRIRADTSA